MAQSTGADLETKHKNGVEMFSLALSVVVITAGLLKNKNKIESTSLLRLTS